MSVQVQVLGLKQLQHALQQLPIKMMNNQMRKAVAPAANLVKEDAIMRAPVDTGRLERSIIIKRITGEPKEWTTYIVVPRHGRSAKKVKIGGGRTANLDAWYWVQQEFGNVKMSAQPFMRPAYERYKGQALTIILNKLATGIDYEATLLKWADGRIN